MSCTQRFFFVFLVFCLLQSEKLRTHKAELDSMHPTSRCWKVPVAQSLTKTRCQFMLSSLHQLLVEEMAFSTAVLCLSISEFEHLYVIERHVDVFLWLVSSCHLLLFCHFLPSCLRFQKIFIYWEHQLLSTVRVLKVSPQCVNCLPGSSAVPRNIVSQTSVLTKHIHLLFPCLYIWRQLEHFVLPRLKK